MILRRRSRTSLFLREASESEIMEGNRREIDVKSGEGRREGEGFWFQNFELRSSG